MTLYQRYTMGADLRDAVFWKAHFPDKWWGVAVCLPLPGVYWCLSLRYRKRFQQKWAAKIETFPRRP